MKTIKLQSLTFSNFKGQTNRIVAEGEDLDIYGRNATGKTTIADAFAWILFDKDSLGRADFVIKNINAEGDTEHGIDHTVTCHLIADGSPINLSKTYREKWSRIRGNPVAVYTGNTTDYFIDGVPVQKKEYQQKISDLAGDETIFRLLTSPASFPALHWQKQRALLLEICGDLTDRQVVESNAALEPLLDILGKRTIDEHRKVVAARRSEINKELEKLPVRIDECRRGMPDVTGLDIKTINASIKEVDKRMSEAKLRLAGVDTGGKIADLSKKLAGINADIQARESRWYSDVMKDAQQTSTKISNIKSEAQEAERRAQSIKDDIAAKVKRIEGVEYELSRLRENWIAIDAETFHDGTPDTCAACGQGLPEDRVQEAREKALAAFNQSKAERLTKIDTTGKSLREEQDRYKADVLRFEKYLTLIPTVQINEAEMQRLTSEYAQLQEMAVRYNAIPGYVSLVDSKKELERQIALEREGVSVGRDVIAGEIAEIEIEMKNRQDDALKFTARHQAEDRIEQLKAQEKDLTTEYERLEQELYLCEQFVRTKVSMLTDRINSKFEFARFKLFDVQVNGAVSECCEITLNGVGYNSNLNSGARINAGLDVCRTLQHHYGLQVPIFVDNAETVCDLLKLDTQMIRLIVSEKDHVLRVERKAGRLL